MACGAGAAVGEVVELGGEVVVGPHRGLGPVPEVAFRFVDDRGEAAVHRPALGPRRRGDDGGAGQRMSERDMGVVVDQEPCVERGVERLVARWRAGRTSRRHARARHGSCRARAPTRAARRGRCRRGRPFAGRRRRSGGPSTGSLRRSAATRERRWTPARASSTIANGLPSARRRISRRLAIGNPPAARSIRSRASVGPSGDSSSSCTSPCRGASGRHGHERHDRVVVDPTHHEAEDVGAGCIEPLQIVDDEDDGQGVGGHRQHGERGHGDREEVGRSVRRGVIVGISERLHRSRRDIDGAPQERLQPAAAARRTGKTARPRRRRRAGRASREHGLRPPARPAATSCRTRRAAARRSRRPARGSRRGVRAARRARGRARSGWTAGRHRPCRHPVRSRSRSHHLRHGPGCDAADHSTRSTVLPGGPIPRLA